MLGLGVEVRDLGLGFAAQGQGLELETHALLRDM